VHHWSLRKIENYWLAIANHRKALELDPTFAPAHAALAEAYMLLGEQGGLPQAEARALAGEAIRKAVELGPDLAEVHTALGVWRLHYEWDWKGSEQAFARAIELNPGSAAAHRIYGRSLGFFGRFDEARRELQRARELDPLSSLIGAHVGQIEIFDRKYDDALERMQQTLELDPHHALVLHSIGEAHLAKGDATEAVTWLERSIEGFGEPSKHFVAMLGCAYARADRRQDALALLDRLRREAKQGLVSSFDMAALQLALGNAERALASLEEGYEQRDIWLVELEAWPWFDSLRDDPRFATLLSRIGFPH